MKKVRVAKGSSTEPDFYVAASHTPLGKREDAFAAIKMSCIGVRGKAGPMELSGLAVLHQRHVDLLQNIGGWVKEDLAFEMRYNFYPALGGRPGRVVAAMRIRVSAGSRDAAVATVRDAARGLVPLLTSLSSSHYWTPVARRGDYKEIFPAARLRHSAEIVRQCLRVQVPSEVGHRDADSLSPTPAGAYRGALSKTQLTGLPLVTAAAADPDGDASLAYAWHCASGAFAGSGNQVTWTAPRAIGRYAISVSVSDGKGGSALRTIDVLVNNALDNLELTWVSGGAALWFAQGSTYYYGGGAAQSGRIGAGQYSYIETTVTGPVALSFYWKVSSEYGGDGLRFYIDGIAQYWSISGNVDWTQQRYAIPAGNHTLAWVYSKNSSISSGSDAGWLDNVIIARP